MTLIGFALYDDRVEAVTDTACYTRNLEHMSTTTKILLLPHLDALVLAQGDGVFCSLAKYGALLAQEQTFDDLAADGTTMFNLAWESAKNDPQAINASLYDSVAFLIGWSNQLNRFAAYMYATEQDCKQIEVKKPFIMPSSTDYRPSGLEARRVRRDHADEDNIDRLVDAWMTKPQMPPPTVEQWVEQAAKARRQRAYSDWPAVLISGDLLHATVSRGDARIRKVHTFDETGDEFLQLVSWTAHPLALARDCWCHSGRTFGECDGTPEHERSVDQLPD